MKRLNYILYVILAVSISFFIVIFSYNAILRVPETYIYHFNDSQVTYNLNTKTTGTEFSREICSYLDSPQKNEFQVYEKNGKFNDPLFVKKEVEIMRKAKKILTISAIIGMLFFIISIAGYVYLLKNGSKSKLKRASNFAIFLAVAMQIVMAIILNVDAIKKAVYNLFIGVNPGKESLLAELVGSPFEVVVCVFATIIMAILIGVFVYINKKLIKDDRIFY